MAVQVRGSIDYLTSDIDFLLVSIFGLFGLELSFALLRLTDTDLSILMFVE
jgi:hypothetical protein